MGVSKAWSATPAVYVNDLNIVGWGNAWLLPLFIYDADAVGGSHVSPHLAQPLYNDNKYT
ncbi:unnamed protein product [Clonostachys solani]|uniref:Uncharacterized protein n=1 Tax=Clonostachys solani TaxID=160281 RepID=A0A9N9ZGT2_9HYPO|nr:unnamed protein product [Clonostachys solani]